MAGSGRGQGGDWVCLLLSPAPLPHPRSAGGVSSPCVHACTCVCIWIMKPSWNQLLDLLKAKNGWRIEVSFQAPVPIKIPQKPLLPSQDHLQRAPKERERKHDEELEVGVGCYCEPGSRVEGDCGFGLGRRQRSPAVEM